MQGLTRNVGHIGVFLDYDVGAYPALSSYNMALICKRIHRYSSDLSSILGNCVPANPFKLHSAFLENLGGHLHHLWKNILLGSHPHISKNKSCLVCPKSSCEGHWIIAVGL